MQRLDAAKTQEEWGRVVGVMPLLMWKEPPIFGLGFLWQLAHDGVHVERVAAGLRVGRAARKEGLAVQFFRGPFCQIQGLQHQDGS